MKNFFWVVILALVIGLLGCASAPIKFYGGLLPKAETVSIGNIKCYKDVKVVGKDKLLEYFDESNDELAKFTIAAFEKEFRERLERAGIKISPESFVTVEIRLNYRAIKTGALSEARGVNGQMLLFTGYEKKYAGGMQLALFIHAPLAPLALGGHEVPARRAAKGLAERFAATLAEQLK